MRLCFRTLVGPFILGLACSGGDPSGDGRSEVALSGVVQKGPFILGARVSVSPLNDVGVPTALVRYPREGHGLRETGHVVDALNRSLAWYRQYFGIQ